LNGIVYSYIPHFLRKCCIINAFSVQGEKTAGDKMEYFLNIFDMAIYSFFLGFFCTMGVAASMYIIGSIYGYLDEDILI
jgi:hypothetical protein